MNSLNICQLLTYQRPISSPNELIFYAEISVVSGIIRFSIWNVVGRVVPQSFEITERSYRLLSIYYNMCNYYGCTGKRFTILHKNMCNLIQ